MGKRYISEFYDLKSRLYKIEIETEKGSGTSNFKLGGKPLTTKMSSEGKHLYSPIKTIGATITMLTDTYNFDLYTGKAQGSKVKITSDNKVVWIGFLTPCCYDMGFDNYWEEVELECVDGIAVLKNIPYVATDDKHDLDTFGNIIFQCLKQSGCYTNLYITDNVQLTANGNESIIEKFRVSQQNFYDKKKDINQTDDDVAWSCYDVLKEICQYLGYTLFADGDEVFIIDYDAIKKGNNKYFKYSLTGSKLPSPTSVTLKYSHKIDGDSYASSGTSISLDEVYNKVSVKDEFYTFDDIFPEFGDENFEENITMGIPDSELNGRDKVTKEDIGMRYYHENNSHYTNMVSDCFTCRTTDKKKNINFQIFTVKGWRNKLWVVAVKFYKSPVLEFKKYEHRDSARNDETADYEKDMSLSRLWNAHGATYYKIWKREIGSGDFNEWRSNYPSNWKSMSDKERFDAWKSLLNQDPTKISLEPMILNLKEYAHNPIKNEEVQNFPFIKLRSTNSNALGGEGAYLIIKGSVSYHDETFTPFPLSDGADNGKLKRKEDWKYASECYLLGLLKWGNQYWNGEAWSDTKTTFPLRWRETTEGREAQKNKNIYDKWFEFIDTAQSKYGCDEKGIYVPVPKDTNLSGNIEFEIYCPHDMKGNSRKNHWTGYDRYYSKVIMVKNLKIQAKISNGIFDDKENNSNTVYTNVINNGSISSMSEIKFKICTFDNKKPTFSAVEYLDNGSSVYVTKTINKALRETEISSFDNKPLLTQEEHLIYKLVTQYENPRVIMECNLHNDGFKLYGTYTDKTINNKTFVITEIDTDYKMNQQTLKLTEKA